MSAPIRITLGVPNDSKPIQVHVESNKKRRQIDVTAPIVAETLPTYEGPYDVSPTESEHTLFTNGKKMTENVSVGAIPSNYLGSEVPRKTSADLTASGPTVTAPAGYYSEDVSKSVQIGSVSVPYTGKQVEPAISVSETGTVYATVDESFDVVPTVDEGYVTSGEQGTVRILGAGVKDLSIQAAKIVTPTETEQTAVAAQKYTTGEVKVAAIPSDYIGSEVPQKSSSDMTISGATVTAPAGYYAEAASKAVSSGSASTPNTSIPVHMDVSLSATGLITATASGSQRVTPDVVEGYVDRGTAGTVSVDSLKKVQLSTQAAQTITPTTADQTIDSGTYLTGAQTIKGDANLLPENIKKDVTIFNVVGSYEGSLTEDTLLKALRNQTTYVEDDTLTSIRSYGLAYCTALISVSFHELQTINSYAFYNDYSLIMNGWPFPIAKTIGNYAFRYCYGLTGDIVLPSTVTSIGQYSFANCDHMETFTATGAISTLGTYTFNGASGHVMALREIHMPNLGTGIALNLNFGSTTAANACQHLEICDIGNAKSIAANTFANCYKLQTLIMRRTSVTTCANVSAFLNTPLRGRSGLTAKIYVPSALIDTYKAASVWTTINGYGYVEWLAIEGSEYEL